MCFNGGCWQPQQNRAGATPLPADVAEKMSINHVLEIKALLGPSIRLLLLTANSAVNASLSTALFYNLQILFGMMCDLTE